MGKLKDAEAQFKEALSIKPDLIPSLIELSRLLVEQKRYEEAIELLKRWASLQPTNITPLIESANIELSRGNKQSAIEYLRRAQQISPQAVSSQIKKYPQLEPFLKP
jgi:tetratricopeptide (TPR) repeat protein